MKSLSSGWIYFISIACAIAGILFFNITDESSIFYKTASKVIGREPQSGDGAFHIPLGWIMMLTSGLIGGILVGFIVNKLRRP